mgnify:CR=1 FL=1
MNSKDIATRARGAAPPLACASTAAKNAALLRMAELLESRTSDILAANQSDLDRARADDLAPELVNRLAFGEDKIASRVHSLRKIADLPDPVGQSTDVQRRPNGLDVARVRVPLGVIMMIYEARPHVTVNAGAFCLKSGNSAILRGGSEVRACNTLLGELWRDAVSASGLPADGVQVITGSHDDVAALLGCDDLIDLVIPRGGRTLIETVMEQSRIPVIKHYEGVCHVYIDSDADFARALPVVIDSKCLMPEVCNAAETLLVHRDAAGVLLPRIVKALQHRGVAVRGCPETRRIVADIAAASDEDWRTEYLDMILSVRVVDSLEAAVDHINTYGSHHTDAIVTERIHAANTFLERVDSGVVLLNASTMYCDGDSLGMGAEIGISTDKLHARGPMGLRDLTSYKFIIRGSGHTMGDAADATG